MNLSYPSWRAWFDLLCSIAAFQEMNDDFADACGYDYLSSLTDENVQLVTEPVNWIVASAGEFLAWLEEEKKAEG